MLDANSWILWTPSLEVLSDIVELDFLVDTLWLPLDQTFAPDEGFGPSHGNDWLAFGPLTMPPSSARWTTKTTACPGTRSRAPL
jgi:hypothetical protein